jgi:predicted phosphatase
MEDEHKREVERRFNEWKANHERCMNPMQLRQERMKQQEMDDKAKSVIEFMADVNNFKSASEHVDYLFENAKYFFNTVMINDCVKLDKQALRSIVINLRDNKYNVELVVIKAINFSPIDTNTSLKAQEIDFFNDIDFVMKNCRNTVPEVQARGVHNVNKWLRVQHTVRNTIRGMGSARDYIYTTTFAENQVDKKFEEAVNKNYVVDLSLDYKQIPRIKQHVENNWILFKQLHFDLLDTSNSADTKLQHHYFQEAMDEVFFDNHTELTLLKITTFGRTHTFCKIYCS